MPRSFPGSGQRVQAPWRAAFFRRRLGILPAALEHAHLLEASERAIERAVRGEQLRVGVFLQPFRQLVAMKLRDAALL